MDLRKPIAIFCTAGLLGFSVAHADTRTNDTTNPNTPTNSQDTQKLRQMPEGNAPADTTNRSDFHKKQKDMNVQKLRQKPDDTSTTVNHADEGTQSNAH